MTMSRSFAPADPAAPPAFPFWPFAFTAYAQHCSRGYVAYFGGYLGRLAEADNATDVIAAEETLGRDWLTGLRQAWRHLFWGPMGAAMATVDRRAPSSPS